VFCFCVVARIFGLRADLKITGGLFIVMGCQFASVTKIGERLIIGLNIGLDAANPPPACPALLGHDGRSRFDKRSPDRAAFQTVQSSRV
jgi:hypothetical protein